jgi:hypothetical protein
LTLRQSRKPRELMIYIYWYGMRNLPTNSSVAQAQVYELQKE